MLTRLRQFTKPGPSSTFQLFKFSKLFKKIFLGVPCPSPIGINWQINFTKKKLSFRIFSKKKKKWQIFMRPSSWYQFCIYFFLKISRQFNCLSKLICQWILDGTGRGIARDILKKYFHFLNYTKKGNKVGMI